MGPAPPCSGTTWSAPSVVELRPPSARSNRRHEDVGLGVTMGSSCLVMPWPEQGGTWNNDRSRKLTDGFQQHSVELRTDGNLCSSLSLGHLVVLNEYDCPVFGEDEVVVVRQSFVNAIDDGQRGPVGSERWLHGVQAQGKPLPILDGVLCWVLVKMFFDGVSAVANLLVCGFLPPFGSDGMSMPQLLPEH